MRTPPSFKSNEGGLGSSFALPLERGEEMAGDAAGLCLGRCRGPSLGDGSRWSAPDLSDWRAMDMPPPLDGKERDVACVNASLAARCGRMGRSSVFGSADDER